MALTWDLTACAETPEVLWSDDRKGLTEVLIFCTIHTGIGHWTADNADEVYARIHLLEKLYGSFATVVVDGERTDRLITPEDVRALIGLRTNVGKPETRASFLKRHAAFALDGAARIYRATAA